MIWNLYVGNCCMYINNSLDKKWIGYNIYRYNIYVVKYIKVRCICVCMKIFIIILIRLKWYNYDKWIVFCWWGV